MPVLFRRILIFFKSHLFFLYFVELIFIFIIIQNEHEIFMIFKSKHLEKLTKDFCIEISPIHNNNNRYASWKSTLV